MRASSQNARIKGTAKQRHNDRQFDVSKSEHIDAARTGHNRIVSWRGDRSEGFEADELEYYNRTYGDYLNAYNSECMRQGHRERCKTMEQYLHAKKSKPEESIYQIGDMTDHVDAQTLWKCYIDLMQYLATWNSEHGNPMKILDVALHDDEATPHIHQRRVWQYHDEQGRLRVGQERALKEAGIDLPAPDMPEGRYNNRKMTFDSIIRDKWLDICEEHGIKIDRDPLPNGRKHKDKEEYIRDQVDKLIDTHDNLVDSVRRLQAGAVDLAMDIVDQYHQRQRQIELDRDRERERE